MQHNTTVTPIEKIVSVLSYLTMGLIGLLWILLALVSKRKLKYFMMYNIAQSMVISMLLLLFKLIFDLIFMVFSKIPVLDTLAGFINYIVSVKILFINPLHMSFSAIQIVVYILLIYICVGVCLGRIFFIPWLTNIMQKAMKSYN